MAYGTPDDYVQGVTRPVMGAGDSVLAGSDTGFDWKRLPGGSTGVTSATLIPGVPVTGAFFGARVFPTPIQPTTMTIPQATAALEAHLGRVKPFGVHRIYVSPAGGFLPSQRDTELADDARLGRTSILSLRPPTGFTWNTLNADASLIPNMVSQLKNTYTHDIVLVIDHETEANMRGTAADYKALVTNIFTRIKGDPLIDNHVSTAINFVGYHLYALTDVTTGAASTLSAIQAQYRAFMPTDMTLVDIIATDPYDYYDGGAGSSDLFASMTSPWLNYAATLGTYYGVFEIGKKWYAGVDRASWWIAAFNYAEAHANFKIFCPWHDNDGTFAYAYPGSHAFFDFWIDDSVTPTDADSNAMLAAFRDHVNRPWFNPVGTSTSSIDPYSNGTLLANPGDLAAFSRFYNFPVVHSIQAPPNADGYVLTQDSTLDQGFEWKPPYVITSRSITGASYTLGRLDAGQLLEVQSAMTITIPASGTVNFPLGTQIEIAQFGTGTVTIAPASTVSINSLGGSLTTAGRYGSIILRKQATNNWHITGALG